LQEKTISQALKSEGYATGHFGKWHLNALRGPGVPIFKDDPHGPAAFGFDRWVSVTNFFEVDPLMSDQGDFKEFKGTSSEVIVKEALQFIRTSVEAELPFFVVIWDGSPHSPWVADEGDTALFDELDPKSKAHYGELVAFDRSVGILRQSLKELDVAENTIIWYCSDNGGLPQIEPTTTGGLKGFKGSVWEGGLRVPAIIEWPAQIEARTSAYPASTMDIFPTLVDILGLPPSVMLDPVDGISIQPIFRQELQERELSIPFRFRDQGALVNNNYKLVATSIEQETFELYDLEMDPGESMDISMTHSDIFEKMRNMYLEWNASVEASILGKDYPEGKVYEDHPEDHFWMEDPRYKPYLEDWVKIPEYEPYILRRR
jgi:arylsulfatase A-like enzyme